jgi:HNH endonuclease
MTKEERFWSNVNVKEADDCWLWQRSLNRDGYGRLSWNRKLIMAHRLAYRLCVGELPFGLELDHLCRNRACVNPRHLEPVTHKINMERGIARCSKKTHCKRGHELIGNNLYTPPDGSRQCRKCDALWMREYRKRKKEQSQT